LSSSRRRSHNPDCTVGITGNPPDLDDVRAWLTFATCTSHSAAFVHASAPLDGGPATGSAFRPNAPDSTAGNGTAVDFVGTRAARWNASSSTAVELQNLDPAAASPGTTVASAINNAGIAVGTSLTSGIGARAVAWKADDVAIDLNHFLSATDAANWRLTQASGISNTYWVSGTADYDPDGNGPADNYTRGFLLDMISVFGTPGDATRDDAVDFTDLVTTTRPPTPRGTWATSPATVP
jgi:hypothetical protein